jgi:hypothetical protein
MGRGINKRKDLNNKKLTFSIIHLLVRRFSIMSLRFYGWFLNRRVMPDTSLRLLMLFRYRLEHNPHLQEKMILGFSRRELCFSTGLSYNSVQSGLRALVRLNIIQLDPFNKGSKHLLKLNLPGEYNWPEIQEKLGFNFSPKKA